MAGRDSRGLDKLSDRRPDNKLVVEIAEALAVRFEGCWWGDAENPCQRVRLHEIKVCRRERTMRLVNHNEFELLAPPIKAAPERVDRGDLDILVGVGTRVFAIMTPCGIPYSSRRLLA